jgi:hypothetical protein
MRCKKIAVITLNNTADAGYAEQNRDCPKYDARGIKYTAPFSQSSLRTRVIQKHPNMYIQNST